jgi:hypothetical protein
MGENTEKRYSIVCSYMEIYNELIYDLLGDRNRLKAETLMMCEDPEKGFYVKGLSEKEVGSMDEILRLI